MKKSKKDKILNLTVLLITVAAIFVFWTVAAASVNSEFVFPAFARGYRICNIVYYCFFACAFNRKVRKA